MMLIRYSNCGDTKMLELKSVSWKNFMSYGDYTSSLELDSLGQVLITGQILDETSDGLRKSNGSGKSTIPNVILWGLFGRTMHSANPGDAVTNFHTGQDCWVKIEFKNGDYIIRTRGKHNELTFCKEGEITSLSTLKNQQAFLNKQLGLDWEIFTSSSFFTQYGKSWLEMADTNRKKALERILHVDRFAFYSTSAKKSLDNINQSLAGSTQKISLHNSNIARLQAAVNKQEINKNNYEETKASRVASIERSITTEQESLKSLIFPDLEKLEKTWSVYNQIAEKISEMEESIRTQSNLESGLTYKINDILNKIQTWNKKSGKQCLTCLQDVPGDYIDDQINPLKNELEALEAQRKDLSEKNDLQRSRLKLTKSKLAERRPQLTIQEGKSIHAEKSRIEREIERLKSKLSDTINEQNPYTETLKDIDDQVKEQEVLIEQEEINKTKSETLFKHYSYIHKVYSERNKIKSYVFKEHIPFINKRLNHYLEMLNLDVRINLTDSLGISSNMWSYDFQSGGERKRTDVAFMLAAFDFHEIMYGRQCNVLVLDEVDGRMDDDGIEGLINIIKQELSQKVETILIISHRNQMHDVFDKEIKVTKSNSFSNIQM